MFFFHFPAWLAGLDWRMETPSIGRIVHYKAPADDEYEAKNTSGDHYERHRDLPFRRHSLQTK
jgi:hypothetical protein